MNTTITDLLMAHAVEGVDLHVDVLTWRPRCRGCHPAGESVKSGRRAGDIGVRRRGGLTTRTCVHLRSRDWCMLLLNCELILVAGSVLGTGVVA